MKTFIPAAVYSLAITVWVGGLLAIGYIAVPVIFFEIPDRILAGNVAGYLLGIGNWVGLVCAVLLLGVLTLWHRRTVLRLWPTQLVLAMLLLGVVGQFLVQPEIIAIKALAHPLPVAETPYAAQFSRWHAVSSILYLMQAVLGLALVIVQGRGRPSL